MEISNSYVNPELQAVDIEKRRQAAQTWADGMQAVVDKTQDPDAQSLLAGVLSGVAVAQPDAERYLVPVQGPKRPTILLIPLFAEDANISDTNQQILAEKSSLAAYYTENIPGRIYFNADISLTPLLKGILMLHEAKHAAFFEAKQFREGNELDHWFEEVATFEFEFKLLEKLCGQHYEDYLAKMLPVFVKEYDDIDGQGGVLPNIHSVDGSVLDEIFGPSLSEREQGFRRSIIWIDTVFKMFEQVYPQTAATDKAQLLRQLYA